MTAVTTARPDIPGAGGLLRERNALLLAGGFAPVYPEHDLAGPELAVLSFFSVTSVAGTPLDVTLRELAIESFYPADQPIVSALRSLAS